MATYSRTITRELKSIPFDQCYQIYKEASDDAKHQAEQVNLEKYERYIQNLELEYSETHESPYEGNFSDQYPYQPPLNLASIGRAAGHKAIAEIFIPRYKLDTIASTWVLPQIIQHISRKPFRLAELVENAPNVRSALVEGAPNVRSALVEGGKLDCLKMLDHIFDRNSEWDLGLYHFLMLDQRSSYLSTQYKGEAKSFCSLVPLILYAFKLNHAVKYSNWSRRNLEYVVNASLAKAMLCEVPEVSRDELLEARDQGLVYKSGAKAGQMRNPVSTYKLYDTTGTKIHQLPDLAKTMLTQIWCAHPQNRTRYMVLDPKDWDNIPTPLVTDAIFKPEMPILVLPLADADMPWI